MRAAEFSNLMSVAEVHTLEVSIRFDIPQRCLFQRLLRETHELNERRLKLESAIRAVDAASKLRLENDTSRHSGQFRWPQSRHFSLRKGQSSRLTIS